MTQTTSAQPITAPARTKKASSAFGNVCRFTGRRFDEASGSYYLRNRYCEPRSGRFIGRDTTGAFADRSHRGNAYTFGGNAAPNGVDPFGTFTVWVHEEITRPLLSEFGVTIPRTKDCVVSWNQSRDEGNFTEIRFHGQTEGRESADSAIAKYNEEVESQERDLDIWAVKLSQARSQQEKQEACNKVTKHLGILTHMVQDVNAHRGMTNHDHRHIKPDSEGSLAYATRRKNAEQATKQLFENHRLALDLLAKEKECRCCSLGNAGLDALSIAGFYILGFFTQPKRNRSPERHWSPGAAKYLLPIHVDESNRSDEIPSGHPWKE